jgi:glycine cleavage system H protein
MYPNDRKYTVEHEWVKVEGDKVSIGITDYAQGELGDIVFVEFPEVGTQFNQGDVMGTIESVKAVSEIYAPVSGKLVAVNETLGDTPEQLNTAPHAEGWYCSLELSRTEEIDALMDAEAYQAHLGDI